MSFHSQINDFWVHKKLTEWGILIIVDNSFKDKSGKWYFRKKQGSSLLTEISRDHKLVELSHLILLIELSFKSTIKKTHYCTRTTINSRGLLSKHYCTRSIPFPNWSREPWERMCPILTAWLTTCPQNCQTQLWKKNTKKKNKCFPPLIKRMLPIGFNWRKSKSLRTKLVQLEVEGRSKKNMNSLRDKNEILVFFHQ